MSLRTLIAALLLLLIVEPSTGTDRSLLRRARDFVSCTFPLPLTRAPSLTCIFNIAAIYNLNPSSNWLATLNGLQAGDTAFLANGDYDINGFNEFNWNGGATTPILLQNAAGASLTQSVLSPDVINALSLSDRVIRSPFHHYFCSLHWPTAFNLPQVPPHGSSRARDKTSST